MTKANAAELLQLLIEQAPKLRAAGVGPRVELDGIKFDLLPLEPEVSNADAGGDEAEEEKPGNPFFDKDTFGRRSVPGETKRGRST